MNIRVLFRLLGSMCALALTACGGLSDVGDQENAESPPDAVVTVIGHASTMNGQTLTVKARAGGELLLSGKDSKETILPIVSFEWQAQNAAAERLPLIKRNNSTIAFQIPADSTTIALRLVVKDSDGRTDQQDVSVEIDAVPDPDQFLTYLDTPSAFTVVAATSADYPPCTSPTQTGCLRTDAPFTIEVEARASYWDIAGRRNEGTTGGDPGVVVYSKSFTGSWLSNLGGSRDCNAISNPAFTVPVPAFDADQIAALVQKVDPDRVADASRVDDAGISLTVSISQPAGSPLPPGAAQVCVPELGATPVAFAGAARVPKAGPGRSHAPSAPATQLEFTARELSAALFEPGGDPDAVAMFDTYETATAYYDTIDSSHEKATFIGWLKANGFLAASATAIDWAAVAAGSDANAIYVNNFDLGFGRDMYMRRLCTVTSNPQPGDCDVASVVVNYGSLEAAAKKLGPQLAVAMEYSRSGDAGARFVKFYTFAPDVRCNPANPPAGGCTQFKRVLSANLDGRGEKYMPGACTICHGGTPLGSDPQNPARYAAGGDVNSSFLPWDSKALLFSDDVVAGFVDDATNAVHHQLWQDTRRSSQADHIKALNQLALLTYVDPEGQANRHALARQLVQGWYSGPGGAHTPDFVPPQWSVDSRHASLYLDVFAQNCRMCHVAQVPNLAAVGTSGLDPFDKCDPQNATSVYTGHDRQIAFGCYQQFANAANLATRVAAGQMPDARLTMDRFWVAASGKSSGETLADHLNVTADSLKPAIRPEIVDAEVQLAGAAIGTQQSFDEAGELRVARRHSLVRLHGRISGGEGEFVWAVQTPSGAVAGLSSSTGLLPSLSLDAAGRYPVSLTAGGVTVNRSIVVPNWSPVGVALSRTVAPGAPSVNLDALSGSTVVPDGDTTAALPLLADPGENGDGSHRLTICGSAATASACTLTSLQTSLSAQVSIVADATAGHDVIRYVPGAPGTDSFRYRLADADGDGAAATYLVSVRVVPELIASSQCDDSTLSLGQSSVIQLQVSGGTQPYQTQFDDVSGLMQDAGPLAWRFTAPGEATQGSPRIMTGPICKPYTVTDGSPTIQSAQAVLTLLVKPRAPWIDTATGQGISNVLVGNVTCTASCHSTAVASGGLDMTGSADDVWQRLHDETDPRVVTTDPLSSRLLQCPGNAAGNTCGHPDIPAFQDDPTDENDVFSRILRWIREGAFDNDATDASCAVAVQCPQP